MNRFLAGVCLAALAVLPLFSANEAPSRLDVSVQPEGARVYVDGKLRGTAPCSVFDLEPGRHLVHVEAASCVSDDAFVKVGRGEFVQHTFSLAPEKGLVLVKTVPAGAEVKSSGVSLGRTPLLLTSLTSGRTHVLDLSLNGYQSKRIDVRPEGRTPIVREEVLPLDSGVVNCTSDPAGATVVVNGVERGVTPLEVTQVPKGLATFTLRLAGYREETRELRLVPGDRQSLSVQLKGLGARVKVVSTPEQAKVFIDNDYQGKTPAAFAATAGEHELRLELPGYAPVVRKVELANGRETTETFSLESVLGRIEVATTPAGARIFVDGKAVGSTRSGGDAALRSQILALESIPAGEHSVVARLSGYQDVSRTLTVKAKDTGRLFLKLHRIFTPDTEIETIRGIHKGVLVEKDFAGNVTLETSPGVHQTFRQEDIRKVTTLGR